MQKLVAAVSAGVLDGQAIVDLNYEEDKLVAVDFNLVATEDGDFVEVQSSGEEATFTGSQLDQMLALARNGISALIGAQRAVLSANYGDAGGELMLSEFVGRLCQAPTSMFVQWRFTETPYNDLIVQTSF